jgi:transcriptional regulator with XRE-family HTH domain
MAASPPVDPPTGQAALPQVLKAIRRRRGLRAAEVAQRMAMAPRSYERFESGRSTLNVARIHQFAKAVDADAYAILIALEIGSPAFALRCVDNKAMTIMIIALQEFDALAGDDIARLEPRALIAAFGQLFDGLTAKAREIDAFVEQWMSDKALHAPADPDDDPDDDVGDVDDDAPPEDPEDGGD